MGGLRSALPLATEGTQEQGKISATSAAVSAAVLASLRGDALHESWKCLAYLYGNAFHGSWKAFL